MNPDPELTYKIMSIDSQSGTVDPTPDQVQTSSHQLESPVHASEYPLPSSEPQPVLGDPADSVLPGPSQAVDQMEIKVRTFPEDLESQDHTIQSSSSNRNQNMIPHEDPKSRWRERVADFGHMIYPFIDPFVPKANFFWFHLGYFIFMGLLGGLILWGLEDNLSYLDGLFVATSAVCVTGLSSVDFSTFSTNGQVLVLVWIFSGGLVMISLVPLLLRLIFAKYRHRFLHLVSNIDDYQELTTQAQRILKILLITIATYIVTIQLIAFIIMGIYLSADSSAKAVMRANGIDNPWWWSLFHTASSFQNAGFALFGSSIVPFSNDQVISLTLTICVMAGNTFFPIFLRFILWIIKLSTCNTQLRQDLQELLRNPRFYYYYLFPSRQTWILLGLWLFITGAEFFIFFVEWNRVVVYAAEFSTGIKLMINFAQTVWVRACGLNNVNIGSLNFGHLAFLIVSMYISAFPFILTLRSSSSTPDKRLSTPGERISRTMRNLIARDLVWLYFVVVLITFIEFGRPSTDPAIVPNSFLNICFEVSSAFGTVGLSTGFPGANYSYSGAFYGLSKFLIILTFLAGRHRGLPALFDTTIRVSGEIERKSRTFSLEQSRVRSSKLTIEDLRIIVEDSGSKSA